MAVLAKLSVLFNIIVKFDYIVPFLSSFCIEW